MLSSALDATPSAAELAQRLACSAHLRRRRYELLPVFGPQSVGAEVQGRGPGASTAPAHLAELISSIAHVGMLQPILVEELEQGERRLVAGERRLRATRWGAVHMAGNPHFDAVPAVVCPGPLSEAERRVWQLVENLAREDLQPGELAAALLFERASVLTAKILAAGVPVPADIATLDDPVARFHALDRIRIKARLHHLGAPWPEVLRRLGIQMSEDQARQLVRAFAALPPELSADMDAAQVALATRLEFLRLDRGCSDAAAELWAAVRDQGAPELLAGAVREHLAHPHLEASVAVERARLAREEANQARADALRRRDIPAPAQADAGTALEELRRLLEVVRNGAELTPYDLGSLRLLLEELCELAKTGGAAE